MHKGISNSFVFPNSRTEFEQAAIDKKISLRVHKGIKFADDPFQRKRRSEYKHVFGVILGAYEGGAINFGLYSSLHNHAFDCLRDLDIDDMEDPEQQELDMEDPEQAELDMED
jgi:hypothetical protein